MEITPVEHNETAPVEPTEAAPIEAVETAKVDKDDPEQKKVLLEKLNLQKQRKAFLRQQAQFKKEREEWEAQRNTPVIQQRDWKQDLAKNPLEVLKEAGISYEQLTNSILNGPSQQDQVILDLQAKIAKLEEGQTSTQEQFKKNQEQQYEQAVKQINNEVKMLVHGNEEFSMIVEMDASEAVTAYIEHKFNDDGVLVSVEDAAREVEEYLTEKALSIAKNKKIQSKLMPVPAAVPIPAPKAQGMRTITHQAGQPVARMSSDKDRRARAIAAFQQSKV